MLDSGLSLLFSVDHGLEVYLTFQQLPVEFDLLMEDHVHSIGYLAWDVSCHIGYCSLNCPHAGFDGINKVFMKLVF